MVFLLNSRNKRNPGLGGDEITDLQAGNVVFTEFRRFEVLMIELLDDVFKQCEGVLLLRLSGHAGSDVGGIPSSRGVFFVLHGVNGVEMVQGDDGGKENFHLRREDGGEIAVTTAFLLGVPSEIVGVLARGKDAIRSQTLLVFRGLFLESFEPFLVGEGDF